MDETGASGGLPGVLVTDNLVPFAVVTGVEGAAAPVTAFFALPKNAAKGLFERFGVSMSISVMLVMTCVGVVERETGGCELERLMELPGHFKSRALVYSHWYCCYICTVHATLCTAALYYKLLSILYTLLSLLVPCR